MRLQAGRAETVNKHYYYLKSKRLTTNRADKVQADILSCLSTLKEGMEIMVGRMSNVEKSTDDTRTRLEAAIGNSRGHHENQPQIMNVSPNVMHDSPAPNISVAMPSINNGNMTAHDLQDDHAQETDYEEDYQVDVEVGQDIVHPDSVPTQNFTIPSQHTTPASRMLAWPSIHKHIGTFIQDDPTIRDFNYTTVHEVKRGVLRLYGRGESSDGARTFERGIRDQHGDFDDTASEVSASPASDGGWGISGTLTPPAGISSFTRMDDRRSGSDFSDTALDLDEKTVRGLARSYMRHMNIMHPIIFPGHLKRWINNLLRFMPDQDRNRDRAKSERRATSAFVGVGRPLSMKRKHSHLDDSNNQLLDRPRTIRPRRTIDMAVLLLILALGKICEHRGKLPNCVTYEQESINTSFSSRNAEGSFSTQSASHASASHNQSPVISPQAMFTPSPMMADRSRNFGFMEGRRASHDSTAVHDSHRQYLPPVTNMDVIPGLAYFAAATDIIGNQLGGNTVRHVQANILASLYHGQLARVAESHAYLWQASRALQVIILGSVIIPET